jgi:eukaryotic-like serine/threonine-protein kinase
MVQAMENKEKQQSEYDLPMQLDQYTLTKLIGKGGMGEIFLAKDPVCQRTVALKRILPKHASREILRKRFLNEPRIAAQLPHPSIIPVYKLHEEKETIYYTMPYIEGQTLREILIKTRYAIEKGLPIDPIGSSIQTLMMMFLNICNAIEYTHSKGFLHRDIKPENIIVGKFNEVVILDWGVATRIDNVEKEESESKEEDPISLRGLTQPGKTVGTVEFMAPERGLGAVSNVLTDIYSLGATLYFILTLHLPFNRPNSLKEWRKQMQKEGKKNPLDPQEVAPYREITPQLSRIAMKCMDIDPSKRYKNVQEIINDVQRYIQGSPEWIPIADFHINKASDWKFQENVLLAKHMAISRYAGVTEWVMLMLSKESYSGNIQLKTKVKLRESCLGLGFLMCVPEALKSKGLESGYLIWIGSKAHPGCKFLRSNVEVINLKKAHLNPKQCYTISMERQDNVFRFFIDDVLILSYTSHIPLVGGHFGLLFRDANFDMDPLTLYSGSQNVLVNCLSVPDALLMSKYYLKALTEYRRIAHSFKGRSEGREATFRAGFTLIEQGKNKKAHAKEYFAEAMEEFEKLHNTPGAPIEYLGKSLVYHAQKNLEEETKCLELALRLYPKHPLKHVLDEHIMFRLHESAHTDRTAAYTFTLLTIRYLPQIYEKKEAQTLIKNLTISWEDIPFIEVPANLCEEDSTHIRLPQQLAFWLARPKSLYELTLEIPKESKQRFCLLENSLSALTALRYPRIVNFLLNVTYQDEADPEFLMIKNTFAIILDESPIEEKLDLLIDKAKPKILLSLLENSLTIKNAKKLLPYFNNTHLYDIEHIWALLLAGKKSEAGKRLANKPISDPSSPYYFLQGCYLASIKGEKAALLHFEPLIETSFPPIATLLGHFLKHTIDLKSKWFKNAFFWEKIQLYRQCALYYTCLNKPRKAAQYEEMIEKEFSKSQTSIDFIDS